MMHDLGKKRRRKTPIEGFHNVPEMLAEARRFVDAVTASEEPSGNSEPVHLSAGEPGTAPPSVASSGPSHPPKKRRTPRSPRVRPGPPSQAAPPGQEADSAVTPTAPQAGLQVQTRSPRAGKIEVLHSVPGRTRLKIPLLKWNDSLADDLLARLSGVPGILDLQVSTVTGNVVVYYRPWELCQPAAQQALQEVCQDLLPGVQPEQLTAALLGQREH
ncbi:MAG: HMA2 domain-containing protein [Desulfobacca sp.]|uniref:HMA2 domain-containing protein n=1 Tax=Desulfobacca sp. TaxID=2067990 RepID=UPI00404A502B